AAAEDLRPIRMLALLAHPQVRLGWPRALVERAAAVLEIGVLRGPAPGPGLSGMRETLSARRTLSTRGSPRACQRLTEEDWDLAAACLDRLELAFAGFTAADHDEGILDLIALASSHRATVEALAALPETGEADAEEDD